MLEELRDLNKHPIITITAKISSISEQLTKMGQESYYQSKTGACRGDISDAILQEKLL